MGNFVKYEKYFHKQTHTFAMALFVESSKVTCDEAYWVLIRAICGVEVCVVALQESKVDMNARVLHIIF